MEYSFSRGGVVLSNKNWMRLWAAWKEGNIEGSEHRPDPHRDWKCHDGTHVEENFLRILKCNVAIHPDLGLPREPAGLHGAFEPSTWGLLSSIPNDRSWLRACHLKTATSDSPSYGTAEQ
jgi:hypothetical protein